MLPYKRKTKSKPWICIRFGSSLHKLVWKQQVYSEKTGIAPLAGKLLQNLKLFLVPGHTILSCQRKGSTSAFWLQHIHTNKPNEKSTNKTQQQPSKQMVKDGVLSKHLLAYMDVTHYTCTLPSVPYTALRSQVLKITVTNKFITSKRYFILEYTSLKQKC